MEAFLRKRRIYTNREENCSVIEKREWSNSLLINFAVKPLTLVWGVSKNPENDFFVRLYKEPVLCYNTIILFNLYVGDGNKAR